MLPLIAATVIGGIVVYFLTHPGGVLDSVTGSSNNTPGAPQSQRGIQIGAHGTSPYSTDKSKIGMGLQFAGYGDSLAGAGAFGGMTGVVATSQAVPIIGAVIGVAAAVWGIMQKHHQEAVIAEAKALNTAAPHFRDTLVQLCAAALNNQIDSDSAFGKLLDQIIDDYYTEVKGIIRGKWPIGMANKPDPCNGPCVVGHYWIESDSAQLRGLVGKIKRGEHGSFNLPEIPAHAGFQGAPSITITY